MTHPSQSNQISFLKAHIVVHVTCKFAYVISLKLLWDLCPQPQKSGFPSALEGVRRSENLTERLCLNGGLMKAKSGSRADYLMVGLMRDISVKSWES